MRFAAIAAELRAHGTWLDAILALLIGLAASTVAFDHVLPYYQPTAGDDEVFRLVSARVAPYREDLLSPCHRRFGFMAEPDALVRLPEWRAFITRKTETFPCEALGAVPIVPVAYNYTLHSHLHRGLTTVFGFTGARLEGFAYYQAIQFGVLLALLYGVFRLGMGRVLSVLAMLPLMLSPRHLEMAIAPIEYAKAPFFAACLLGTASLVVLRWRPRAAYMIAALTGLSVGIGFGFKPDVLTFAPFGVLAILLFTVTGSGAGAGHRWRLAAAYTFALLVAGAPLIERHFFGPQKSLLPVQLLGGMAPAFSQDYANPAIYDYGVMFDDDHVIAVINSYHQRVNGSQEFGPFFSAVIQQGATDLVLRLYRTFTADIIVRTYAAILQVFQFAPFGLVFGIAVLLGLCRRQLRVALFVAFTLVYMVGYVSLVFAPKHYFHLEFVPWWFIGCTCAAAGAWLWRAARIAPATGSPSPRSWLAVAAIAVVALSALGGTLALARVVQDRQVRALLTRYVDPANFEPLVTTTETSAGGALVVIPEGVPLAQAPTQFAGLPVDVFFAPKVETAYVSLRVACRGERPVDVTAAYQRPAHWRDAFAVPCERSGQQWTLLWPVYQHLPQQVFKGFEFAGPEALDVLAVSRVRDVAAFPLLLRLRLPDDWAARDLHHTLNLSKVSPARRRPVPAALTTPPPALAPPAVSWAPPSVAGMTPLASEAPGLASWTLFDGVTVSDESGVPRVQGNLTEYGYQLTSPPIAVPPHSRIVVRVFGTVDEGRVAFGILDGAGARWLLPAVWGRSDFVANTEANDRVVLVFANYRQPGDPAVASRFAVQSISYQFENQWLDRVRTLLWPVQP